MIIYDFKKTTEILEKSENKAEILAILRLLIPESDETYRIIKSLAKNNICDAEIRLEVALKVDILCVKFTCRNLRPTEQDIFVCAEKTELLLKILKKYVCAFGETIALRIKDKNAIEQIYDSATSTEILRALAGNSNASAELIKKLIKETKDTEIKEIATRTLEIINIKTTKDADYIERIYSTAPYEIKYAALSNLCNRREFLQKIIADKNEFKSLVEVASKTLEISST